MPVILDKELRRLINEFGLEAVLAALEKIALEKKREPKEKE